MGFFTSFQYTCPEAPAVTATQLADFLRQLKACDALDPSGLFSLQAKYGKAIDRDRKPTFELVEIARGMCETREIAWDIDNFQCSSINDVIDSLSAEGRTIYRAHAMLGSVSNEVFEAINRKGSPENDRDLTPDTWSIQLGPITACGLEWEKEVHVGWLSVGVSGYGYLYPWTFRDWVQHAQTCPAIMKVCELCRQTWPCSGAKPGWSLRRARKSIGKMWLGETLKDPVDWYWTCSETG